VIYAQDYLPQLPWRGVAEVIRAKGCHIGKDDLRWLNKLEALVDSPFEETIFFDCDMVSTAPVADWFERLGTDDLTFWHYLRTPEDSPDLMIMNLLNAHRFCPHYGVAGLPAILGGGHYFIRKSGRSQRIVDRTAAIMMEAKENPRSLYWKLAGEGNIVGDEPAASMAMVEHGVKLPPALTMPESPVGCFIPGWQSWREADFEQGRLRYWCEWSKKELSPPVMHFAHTGKNDADYNEWLASCLPGAERREKTLQES
jgi:ribosomal protein L24E